MSQNNRVTLKGIIGAIRYFQTKDKMEAVGISLGTRDSYKDEDGKFHNRATVWHNDLFAFSPKMVEHTRNFAKDDLVELEGQLEYRKILDDKGNRKSLASVVIKSLEKKLA